MEKKIIKDKIVQIEELTQPVWAIYSVLDGYVTSRIYYLAILEDWETKATRLEYLWVNEKGVFLPISENSEFHGILISEGKPDLLSARALASNIFDVKE